MGLSGCSEAGQGAIGARQRGEHHLPSHSQRCITLQTTRDTFYAAFHIDAGRAAPHSGPSLGLTRLTERLGSAGSAASHHRLSWPDHPTPGPETPPVTQPQPRHGTARHGMARQCHLGINEGWAPRHMESVSGGRGALGVGRGARASRAEAGRLCTPVSGRHLDAPRRPSCGCCGALRRPRRGGAGRR